ncbi:hypothetical protein SAMN05192533_115132 [Mesobacillus persicus]|uniref:Uncharacterized protein n=1 Tax=Mesobacillus persicus TaxID=930146 RepID=A0A1H8HTL0_9BACI|nr:hypothetical protein [Mesobacillus persicus]SEN59463.1 hypothetical protein SAMN05192533_115132 [Mesobacillus persicus]
MGVNSLGIHALFLFHGLIGAEGTKTPAGVQGQGRPAGAKAMRRLPDCPKVREVPGAEINNHV